MAKFLSHAYGNVMSAITKTWNSEIKLLTILNWFDRKIDVIFPPMKDGQSAVEYINKLFDKRIDGNDKDARLKAYGAIRMVRYLCSFKKIDIWNPKDGTEGLLGLKDLHRLELHESSNGKKGGIKPFRIGQIAYSLGVTYAKKHGEAYTIPSEEKNGQEAVDAFHAELLGMAKAYHAKANRKFNAKVAKSVQNNDKGEQPAEEIGELTIDHILNGEVNLNEIDNVDLLKEAHHFANGGKKGAITRRLKVLEVEI